MSNQETNKRQSPPNLFDYATSELSQDAFICWLLMWANADYAEAELHECAQNFVKALIKKGKSDYSDPIKKIEVKRQWQVKTKGNDRALDILCKVNDNLAILIEDKTFTSQHNEQLPDYYRYAEEVFKEKLKYKGLIGIYFKTGDQGKLPKDSNWHPFMREDFLAVLKWKNIKNNIFIDFYNRLKRIDDDVNAWEKKSLDEWTWSAWTGFYVWLQGKLNDGSWGAVNSKSGAFNAFWWGSSDVDPKHKMYLQIEARRESHQDKPYFSHKVCIKTSVKTDKKDRKSIRSESYKKIKDIFECAQPTFDGNKPKRFGSGKTMTIFEINNVIVTKADGFIDEDKTKDNMKRIAELIKTIK